jgi:hypothetical protein
MGGGGGGPATALNDLGSAGREGRDARDDLPLASTSHRLGVTGHGVRASHGEMGQRPWEGATWGDAGDGHGMACRPWEGAPGIGSWGGAHGRGVPAMGRWGRRPWEGAPSMGRGPPAMGSWGGGHGRARPPWEMGAATMGGCAVHGERAADHGKGFVGLGKGALTA